MIMSSQHCWNIALSLDLILVPSVVSVIVPFTELHEHAYLCCSCFGTKLHCLPTYYGNVVVRFLILHYCNKYCFSLVSHRNMHLPIVLCCGTGRALFTNKLSKQWCQIYLCTKFVHVSIRVTETCISNSDVWAEVIFCGFPKKEMFT